MKKENGITLIALVVTIIVLLILASVSLNLVMGENGMLGKATSSRNTHIIKAVEEKMMMGANTASIEGLGTITYENLKNGIKDVFHGEYNFQESKAENELVLGEVTIDPKNNDTNSWRITAKTDGGKAQVIVGKHGETQKSTDEPEEDPSGDEEEESDENMQYADIFNYRVLNEENLTAEITGIKNEHWYYDSENGYYNISEDPNPTETSSTIDELRVPNHWTQNGKTYKITSVDLGCKLFDYHDPYSEEDVYAYTNLPSVNKIVYPNTVQWIETKYDVMHSCSSFENKIPLSDVTLPKNLQCIGDWTFANCCFSSIDLPSSLKTIGDYAFFKCEELSSLELPNSITEIGECAFFGCEQLENLRIPDSIMELGWNAFKECSNLTLEIPASVNLDIIDEWAFIDLKKVILYSNDEKYFGENADQYKEELGNYWGVYDDDGLEIRSPE